MSAGVQTRAIKFSRLAGALLALSLLVGARPAAGQVVYDGGPPDGGAGFDIFNDYRAADDFALGANTQFNRLRFWGLLPGGASHVPNIFWEILADAGGAPGASIASGLAPAAATLRAPLAFGFDSWQFEFFTGAQTLGPGAYWLALHDGAPGDITDSSLLWETSAGGRGGDFGVELLPTAEWSGGWGGNLAFQAVDATVTPEPASMLLIGTGLAAVAAAKRRRRRSTAP